VTTFAPAELNHCQTSSSGFDDSRSESDFERTIDEPLPDIRAGDELPTTRRAQTKRPKRASVVTPDDTTDDTLAAKVVVKWLGSRAE
jgi:hypothetical protein